ncbi:hypothetical protein OIV83_001349 [Microbotryomycetes sp. JL201]|nr:hypothetical protein OIV83_001349 [Microbotryomycetes sp. JL201]
MAAHRPPPPKDPQVMSIVEPLTPGASTVHALTQKALVWWIVLLVALAAVYVQRTVGNKHSKRRLKVSAAAGARHATTTAVLCGPLAAGKTALLTKLALGTAPHTHTSIKENEATVTHKLASHRSSDDELDQERLARPLHIVDTPGHPRLRTRLLAQFLPIADGVVFVIDAATGLSGKNIRDAAEHLHVVLCLLATLVEANRSHEPARLLILLSKADLVPALSASAASTTASSTLASATDSPVSPSIAAAAKSSTLAVDRAKQSLAREMDRRRQATFGTSIGANSASLSNRQLAGAKLEGLDAIPTSSSSSSSGGSLIQSILSRLGLASSGSGIASGPVVGASSTVGLPNDENEVLGNSELAFPFEGSFEWDKLKEYVDVQWAVASVGSIGGAVGGAAGNNSGSTKLFKPAQLDGLWQWIEQL